MKRINKMIVVAVLAINICWTGALDIKIIQAAAHNVLSYDESRNESEDVTLYIKDVEKLTKYYTTYIYYDYEAIDGNAWYENDKKVTFQKSGYDYWKYKLTFKKRGIYKIYVRCVSKNDDYMSFRTNKIKIKYDNTKPRFELKKPLTQLKIGGNLYKKYYDFLGNYKQDGNTYYYKGNSAKIGVIVYEGAISVNDIKCRIGNTTYNVGTISRNAGHVSKQFTINGEVDGQVSFTATNKNGISESKTTGKTIVIDNTKPVIKIDSAYSSKGKTIYKNKSTPILITITEKHFDSSNTKVSINGKNTKVLWQLNGDKHTAKITLNKGENIIQVISTDKAGNASGEVKSAKIVIDTDAPTVKISDDVENERSYGNRNGQYTQYSIAVKISDKYLAENQTVILYRINAATNKVLQKTKLTGIKRDDGYHFKLDNIKKDGYYKLEVSATDKAGNKITDKSLKKQGKYKIIKGKAVGYFYINRDGSKYEIDESSKGYYDTSINKMGDIVIYEYNINSIKKKNQQVTLITTFGEKTLILDRDYTWQDISKNKKDDTYQYVYKYTIKPENFSDGLYSIKILSSADVIGDGNNSLKVEASNDIIMNQIINYDTKEPEILLIKKEGSNILIHVRDENPDINSAKLKIGGKTVPLVFDDDLSTSTNIYYSCNWNVDVSNAEFTFSDLAGNRSIATSIHTSGERNSFIRIMALLAVTAILLIAATIIIIVVVKRKNNRRKEKNAN